MYFSKNEFTADPEIEAEASRRAQEAVRLAEQHFGIELNGTSESISALDPILDRIRAMLTVAGITEQAAEPFAQTFGSYFGEVLRRQYGGEWGILRVFSDRVVALRAGSKEIILVPWGEVREQILEGPEHGLQDYYERVCRALDAAEVDFAAPEEAETDQYENTLYPLQPSQGYFDAGMTADGRQVLMSFFWTGLTAVFFDRHGALLEHQVRPLPAEPECHPGTGISYHTPAFDAAVARSMKAWRREIGFRPTVIRVRRFYVPELEVGIEELPSHFEEFLRAPEFTEPDEEERRLTFASIREWRDSGSFVLYWGNDLWLDGEGTVTSS